MKTALEVKKLAKFEDALTPEARAMYDKPWTGGPAYQWDEKISPAEEAALLAELGPEEMPDNLARRHIVPYITFAKTCFIHDGGEVDPWYPETMARVFNRLVRAGKVLAVMGAGMIEMANGLNFSADLQIGEVDHGPDRTAVLFLIFFSKEKPEEINRWLGNECIGAEGELKSGQHNWAGLREEPENKITFAQRILRSVQPVEIAQQPTI